ncbi:hypothetical protein ACNKHN_02250 [Shigella flexneri]
MPPRVADVRESWRDKESHTMRLVTVTVLSIIPIAFDGADHHVSPTLRLSRALD